MDSEDSKPLAAIKKFRETRGRHEGEHDSLGGVSCSRCEMAYVEAEADLDSVLAEEHDEDCPCYGDHVEHSTDCANCECAGGQQEPPRPDECPTCGSVNPYYVKVGGAGVEEPAQCSKCQHPAHDSVCRECIFPGVFCFCGVKRGVEEPGAPQPALRRW